MKRYQTPSKHKVRSRAWNVQKFVNIAKKREWIPQDRDSTVRMKLGEPDPNLTSLAGMVPLVHFLEEQGIFSKFRSLDYLKLPGSTYLLSHSLRTMLLAILAGSRNILGVERWVHDPVFQHLLSYSIPHSDTLYRDLARFSEKKRAELEDWVAEIGCEAVAKLALPQIHVDIDSSTLPVFGNQQGAERGYNPRYHGRPSYQPLFAVVKESKTVVGACLRPGNLGWGDETHELIRTWLERLRVHVGKDVIITVRCDSAGDDSKLLELFEKLGVFYVIRPRATSHLVFTTSFLPNWETIDQDAFGYPTTQVCRWHYPRDSWKELNHQPIMIAVRTTERENANQRYLWEHLDHSTQFYLTNNPYLSAEEIRQEYDGRASVETTIKEWKQHFGLGSCSLERMVANHVQFLLKLLAYNLLVVYQATRVRDKEVACWNGYWFRSRCIWVPGKVISLSGQCVVRPAFPIECEMLN